MLKLVVCIMILAVVCCAQEKFTCFRSDEKRENQQNELIKYLSQEVEALRNKSRGNQTNELINSLFPEVEALKNKSRGNQQNKLINSLSQEVEALKNKSRRNHQNELINSLAQEVAALKKKSRQNQQNKLINSLSQEVEALRNQSRINRQLIVDVFSKGLYVPPHVYIYRRTPGRQSWQESQKFCRKWGGDLAMHGVKTLENRRKLIQNLPIDNIDVWIGANDIASERNWVWVNGERASSSELIWQNGQPSHNHHGGNEDCVLVAGYPGTFKFGTAWDAPCSAVIHGLCEKQI